VEQPRKTIKPAKNEFVDNLPPGFTAQRAPEAPAAPEITQAEFEEYFATEVTVTAARFGLVATLSKAAKGGDEFSGPTARYHRETGEMRVFSRASEVPVEYITADEFFIKKD